MPAPRANHQDLVLHNHSHSISCSLFAILILTLIQPRRNCIAGNVGKIGGQPSGQKLPDSRALPTRAFTQREPTSGLSCPVRASRIPFSCFAPGTQRAMPTGCFAGSPGFGASVGRAAVADGATLFGFTSVLPTNVTPSSIASLDARMSPKSSVFALISSLSLATMFPLIFPRTITVAALMLPLTTALSPRFSVPSVLISPSSLPSKVSSPANFKLPLISTSDPSVFFVVLAVVFMILLMTDVFYNCAKIRIPSKQSVQKVTHRLRISVHANCILFAQTARVLRRKSLPAPLCQNHGA